MQSGSGRPRVRRPAVDAVRDLWELARAEGDRGRPVAAVRAATRAVGLLLDRCPGESVLHAGILLTLAYHKSELGEITEAHGLLDQAELIDPNVHAEVSAARGGLLARSGRSDEAIRHLDVAAIALRGDGTTHGLEQLSTALLNRGVLHMFAGRLPAAQADTEEAASVAKIGGLDVVDFMATHNLGYIRYLAGDLPGALHSMAVATDVHPGAATGIPALDRARVLLSAGLLAEAKEFTDQAIATFRKNRATTDLADALQVSAELDILTGDASSAIAKARRAGRIASIRGNERSALIVETLGQRAALLSRRAAPSPARARRDAERAEDLANRLWAADLVDDARAVRLLEAEALLDTGDDTGAEKLVIDAAGDRATSLAARLHTRLLTGRIALFRGQSAKGLSQVRRGLDDLADFQARFGSQDLQSAAAVHGRELTRLGLRTAVATGSPAAILQWLERARAATTRLPAVRPPLDPVLAEDLGALRIADEHARAALLYGGRDAAADRRVAELRRRVRARSWTAAGSGRADRPPTLTAVQRQLAQHLPDAGVVALFVGAGQIHALVITARRAVHLVLAERDAMGRHRHRLQSDLDLLAEPSVPAQFTTIAARSLALTLQQFADVFTPVLDVLDAGPVMIAAVGPLATVPWLLLPGLTGRPVTVSSSVTRALAGLGRPAAPAAEHGVLVVAGPGVSNGDQEALAVAALHPGSRLLVGSAATGRAVLDAIPQGGLVHIAAHGHHEAGNPLFSGVQLADGLLFGYDLAPNPTLPGQVVLSSCDVGQTDDRPGGEPLGLVAALVRSGVPTVISGTSKIADSAAEAATVGYHQRLIAGGAPASALAGAVADAAEATGRPAPFSCFGAGR